MADLTGLFIGRYQLLELLGKGGMALVYRALDTSLEREVAVKLIRMEAFPEEAHGRLLARFEREARTLARLSHPGIVQVHDYGEHEGAPYLVMTLLTGGTLKDRTGSALHFRVAADLLALVAEALAYAHGRGVLHRDVKPANILLTSEGRPVLTDFGIARLLEMEDEPALTGTGVGVGTPDYMAPEQGLGGEVDGRADEYALGIVLYELVTGRKPYTADTPLAVMIKQIRDPLPRPRQFAPGLPETVEQVLMKALAKQPDDRYVDMAAFAAALHALEKLPDEQDPLQQPAALQIHSQDRNDKIDESDETRDELESLTGSAGDAQENIPPSWWKWALGAAAGTGVILVLAAAGLGLSWLSRQRSEAALVEGESPVISEPLADPAVKIPVEDGQTEPSTDAVAISNPELSSEEAARVRALDGMVELYVPEGNFLMGSTNSDPDALDEEFPQRSVYLDAYWIDETEVTNSMYASCVAAGACSTPLKRSSSSRDHYYDSDGYGDFPVIWVRWDQAVEYCSWVGARLPTEAEWEKAARGTDDRRYPWGSQTLSRSLANYGSTAYDTTAAGSYPEGAGPYGTLDMAGNVWEWVSDWYEEGYYLTAPAVNPAGAVSGEYRVMRGGSFGTAVRYVRISNRYMLEPFRSGQFYGFRCANGD